MADAPLAGRAICGCELGSDVVAFLSTIVVVGVRRIT